MRHLLLAVPFALFASTALAAWESGMVEDEGGPVMMAWVYGNAPGDVAPELRLACGGDVMLRFSQGAAFETVAPITEPVAFTFDFGDESVTLDLQYEEMDGAYAAYFSPSAPIIGLLRSKDTLAVDAPTGPWPVQEFTLAGSSKAISAVLKSCD